MRFTAFDATNVEGLPAVPEAAARTWSYPQYPYRIECASAVLEEIRREAESGRASRAGREMGGVLFGVQKSDSIHILACRLLPCEHAMGPGFVLSKKDEDCLAQLIASPGRDPALHGLLPLGWYHSHIHSRICLSERDRQLHFRYFDAPYQIAMVIRCSAERPARAGFFFREPSGAMYTESSYEEFTIDAPPCARPALPQPSTSPAGWVAARCVHSREKDRAAARRDLSEVWEPATSALAQNRAARADLCGLWFSAIPVS